MGIARVLFVGTLAFAGIVFLSAFVAAMSPFIAGTLLVVGVWYFREGQGEKQSPDNTVDIPPK